MTFFGQIYTSPIEFKTNCKHNVLIQNAEFPLLVHVPVSSWLAGNALFHIIAAWLTPFFFLTFSCTWFHSVSCLLLQKSRRYRPLRNSCPPMSLPLTKSVSMLAISQRDIDGEWHVEAAIKFLLVTFSPFLHLFILWFYLLSSLGFNLLNLSTMPSPHSSFPHFNITRLSRGTQSFQLVIGNLEFIMFFTVSPIAKRIEKKVKKLDKERKW